MMLGKTVENEKGYVKDEDSRGRVGLVPSFAPRASADCLPNLTWGAITHGVLFSNCSYCSRVTSRLELEVVSLRDPADAVAALSV